MSNHEIEVSTIEFGERERKDYGDIEDLAESISRIGLINPITIERPNKLRAGGRRLTAVISLGWKVIPCRYFDELNDHERLEVELEENIKRKDLTWQEEVRLKKRINELKKTINPEWNNSDTARLFGVSERHIRRELELADAIESDKDLTTEKDKATALTKLRRKKDTIKRSLEVASIDKPSDNIMHGDAVECLKTVTDQSVDLVLFDPPFAVGFDKKDNWMDKYDNVYGDLDDSTETIIPLVANVLTECYRTMKEGAHLYMFYSITPVNYMAFYKTLHDAGFNICGYPLMWIKPSNHNPMPYHRFALNYEPFFFAWKGKQRELGKAHNATFSHDVDKSKGKHHPAQKPPSLYADLIEISSNPGETVLDPMMGSGMSLATAKRLGREIIGIEKEKSWYELSLINITDQKGGDK